MTDRRNTGLGEHGEKLAERHLVDQGMTVVQRRHRTRQGEIDLICRDGQTLVFVEVKTRRGDRGLPSSRSPRTSNDDSHASHSPISSPNTCSIAPPASMSSASSWPTRPTRPSRPPTLQNLTSSTTATPSPHRAAAAFTESSA